MTAVPAPDSSIASATTPTAADSPAGRPDLQTEAIVVTIRWFGLILGFVHVNVQADTADRSGLHVMLLLGLGYTLWDTWFYSRRRVFLGDWPLVVSSMESLFIGLLCFWEDRFDSPFRFYYVLSLVCCGIRHSRRVTYATCLLHVASYSALYAALPEPERRTSTLISLSLVLIWLTWAICALTAVLREARERLSALNAALRESQGQLETRIAERTQELQETQAQLMHQDKMAGFGLLAAGIAHEVGNPLASISGIVQMLEKRNPDEYTREKLGLVGGQLQRIQGILRELTTFSRPANPERTRFPVREIVDEALGIVKYYKGTKTRTLQSYIAEPLPVIRGVRDQLTQVVFNLILNAIDATDRGGSISVSIAENEGTVEIAVGDNGAGIRSEDFGRIFQPYFTTKRQGTGLGLFVSRKIVREHGGEMVFESQVGTGTTFRVRIPVTAAEG